MEPLKHLKYAKNYVELFKSVNSEVELCNILALHDCRNGHCPLQIE